MSTQKPVYSRPSDNDPAPAPKKRKRRHKRKNAALTAVNESLTPHEGDGVAFHHPITEAKGVVTMDTLDTTRTAKKKDLDTIEVLPSGARRRVRHRRATRRLDELRAENEKLHRRLAAVYDALSLD